MRLSQTFNTNNPRLLQYNFQLNWIDRVSEFSQEF